MRFLMYLTSFAAAWIAGSGSASAQDNNCVEAIEKITGDQVRLEGTVEGVFQDGALEGVCEDSVYLKMSGKDGERTVFLAPRSYLGRGDTVVQQGQKIEVVGIAHQAGGTAMIIAKDIVKPSGQVVSVRDDQWRALWTQKNGRDSRTAEKGSATERAPATMTAEETAGQATRTNRNQAQEPAPSEETTVGASGSRSDEKSAAETGKKKVSVQVGHNVVDAVDDVRETTADLAEATADAKGYLAGTGAEDLQTILTNLDAMEKTLDSKAEATDSSWLNWMADRDYSVTVKDEIKKLGEAHKKIAKVLQATKAGAPLQVVVGHNLVDQVDDSRETIGDLINAINNAGPQLGWFDEDTLFQDHQKKLNAMEKVLDEKAEAADANESIFATNDFRVMVHDQINTLGEILLDIGERITVPQVSH